MRKLSKTHLGVSRFESGEIVMQFALVISKLFDSVVCNFYKSGKDICMTRRQIADALGLLKPQQLALRRIAIQQAAEESGVDYSAILNVLETPEMPEKDALYDLDREVDLFLQEVEKDVYCHDGKFIHLPPGEEARICSKFSLNRAKVLKRLEERGLIKVSYDGRSGTRKKHYTAKSVFFDRRRCVQLSLNCINIQGE